MPCSEKVPTIEPLMNVIPAHSKDTLPICEYHRNLLIVGYGADIFVRRWKPENRGLVASFRLGTKNSLKSLSMNNSPLATETLIAAVTENEVFVVNVGTGVKASSKVSAKKLLWDTLAPASFFVATKKKQLQRFTLSEDSKTLVMDWEIQIEHKIFDAVFSEYDPHYLLLLTKSDDICLMERRNVSDPLTETLCLNWFSGNEPPVAVLSLPSEFFGVVTSRRVYLFGIRSKCLFEMMSDERTIIGAFPTKSRLPSVLTITSDGLVQCYRYNQDCVCEKTCEVDLNCKPNYIGSDGSFFVLQNESSIFECEMRESEIVIKDVNELQTCDASQPVALCENNLAFVNGVGSLIVIDLRTFEVLLRMDNIEKIKSMKFFSENEIVLQIDKKLRVLGTRNSETKVVDIDIDSVVSFQVCLEKMITVEVSDKTLINVNNSFTNTGHSKKIKGLLGFATGVHPLTNEIVVTVSIYGDGVRHYNEKFEEIDGHLKLSGRIEYYSDVTLTGPYVVLFSNYGRIIRIDLRSYELKGPFDEEQMRTVAPAPDGKLCFTTEEHLIQLNNQFVVCLKLAIDNSKVLGMCGKTFYLVYQGSVVAVTNEKRPSLLEDLDIPEISVDDLMTNLTSTIQLLLRRASAGNDVDDICMLLDIPHETVATKDFRQMYHRNFLSFVGADMPDEKRVCLEDFASKFAEGGNFLTAASIMHILGDKEKCVSYLRRSRNYFDIAILYARRIGDESLKDKIIDEYVSHLLSTGDIIRAVGLHMSERTHNKAESMQFALNFRNQS